jgi:2-dehydro-3-deoxyglucarate aldolase
MTTIGSSFISIDGGVLTDPASLGLYATDASMGLTAKFGTSEFIATMERIHTFCEQHCVPCGVHVVMPEPAMLEQRITEGYRFITYSIDAVFLRTCAEKLSSIRK